MNGLQTTDYHRVNDLVTANQYLVEDWERRTAKAAMIAALHWSLYEDELNRQRINRMKERGLVIETEPIDI